MITNLKDTITELLGSKRFVCITGAVVVGLGLVMSGKLPLADWEKFVGGAYAFLSALYGAENVATALTAPPTPNAPPGVSQAPETPKLPEYKSPL